jgi:hypothetical protein
MCASIELQRRADDVLRARRLFGGWLRVLEIDWESG